MTKVILAETTLGMTPQASKLREELLAAGKDVAVLLPDPRQHLLQPRATVAEAIAYPLEQRGISRQQMQQRVEGLAAQLGLTDLLERDPDQLSGGQTRKLALATVLAPQPEVVLAHIPTAGLDPLSTQQVLAALAEVETIIFSPTQIPGLPSSGELAAGPELPHPITPNGHSFTLTVSATRGAQPAKWWRKARPASFHIGPVTIPVQGGAVTWLKGANGAGKTTILRALAGLDPASSITHNSPVPLSVGLTWQAATDQIVFSTVAKMVPNQQLLQQVTPAVKPDTHPLDLTPGQLRQVQVVSELSRQPELLLVDEPSVDCTAATAGHVLRLLALHLQQQKPLILTSHDEAFVAQLKKFAKFIPVQLP